MLDEEKLSLETPCSMRGAELARANGSWGNVNVKCPGAARKHLTSWINRAPKLEPNSEGQGIW